MICLLLNSPVKYIYICHIYLWWKLLDLIKNWKKSQYAGSLPSATDGNGLFAVCSGRQTATWHPAVLPGSWPIWSICLQWQTAKSKRVCRQRRTAKACHVVMCRWHHMADGKGTRKFAVRGGRQRPAVSHLTDWRHNYCRPPYLPSAVDGQEPLPSAARKQTAK